jgi:hypothetical protein
MAKTPIETSPDEAPESTDPPEVTVEVVEETKPAPRRRPGVGAAAPEASPPKRPHERKWDTSDVEDLWPQILSQVQSQGRHPSEIDIGVAQLDPGPRKPLGRPINGAAVMGTAQEGATAALIRTLDDQFHLARPNSAGGGPAKYEITFRWRANAQKIGVGHVERPSHEECISIRNAQMYAYRSNPYQPPQGPMPPPAPPIAQTTVGYGAPSGGPAPPQAAPPQAPPVLAHPQGYGGYYPQNQPTQSPHDDGLRAQVGFLSGQLEQTQRQLQDLIGVLRSGGVGLGAPAPQAQPAPAPPPQYGPPPTAFIPQPFGQPPAPPPPPPPAPTRAQGLRDMALAMRETAEVVQGLKDFHEGLGKMFSGQPIEVPSDDETLGAPPEENAADKLPFEMIPIPFTAGAYYAKDKETGGVHTLGTIMGNDAIRNVAADIAGTIGKAVGNAIMGAVARKAGGVPPGAPAQIGVGTPVAPTSDGQAQTPAEGEAPANGQGQASSGWPQVG